MIRDSRHDSPTSSDFHLVGNWSIGTQNCNNILIIITKPFVNYSTYSELASLLPKCSLVGVTISSIHSKPPSRRSPRGLFHHLALLPTLPRSPSPLLSLPPPMAMDQLWHVSNIIITCYLFSLIFQKEIQSLWSEMTPAFVAFLDFPLGAALARP